MKKHKKIALFIVIVCLIVAAGYLVISRSRAKNSADNKPGATITNPIDFSPPTKEERESGNDAKTNIVDANTPSKSPSGSLKPVVPTITYAGQYSENVEVGGFIGSIVEDGGTCTATFNLGQRSFTSSSIGSKNASSTNCPTISVPSSQFNPKGVWGVVLTYSSTTASGSSSARQIEVK